jgi:cobalamin biosynthesis Co2+ chelatase CbiK
MRFYVEGHEVDVADPSFFMDGEEYTEIKQTLDEMLNTYADLPMAKPR